MDPQASHLESSQVAGVRFIEDRAPLLSYCNAAVFLYHFCYSLQFFNKWGREAFLLASGIQYGGVVHKLSRAQRKAVLGEYHEE